MSVTLERNGKWVELETFSNEEVITYLAFELNIEKTPFGLMAKPKFCNGVMAKFDEVNFIIHASGTWIELSFEKANAQKMSTVIETIKKWDKFSQTEETFYVEIDEGNSRTIIFENGYATCEEYTRKFTNDALTFNIF